MKKLWLTCLFKLTFFGRKRTTFQEFSERAFTMYGWHKEETKDHPLYKKYFKPSGEPKAVDKKKWDTRKTIKDDECYEPLRKNRPVIGDEDTSEKSKSGSDPKEKDDKEATEETTDDEESKE